MKVYSGKPPDSVFVSTDIDDEHPAGTHGPLAHRMRHSPTGFRWGYSGSGPADLAASILWDLLDAEPSPALYQAFKYAFVAYWDADEPWEISGEQIHHWIDKWRAPRPYVDIVVVPEVYDGIALLEEKIGGPFRCEDDLHTVLWAAAHGNPFMACYRISTDRAQWSFSCFETLEEALLEWIAPLRTERLRTSQLPPPMFILNVTTGETFAALDEIRARILSRPASVGETPAEAPTT